MFDGKTAVTRGTGATYVAVYAQMIIHMKVIVSCEWGRGFRHRSRSELLFFVFCVVCSLVLLSSVELMTREVNVKANVKVIELCFV